MNIRGAVFKAVIALGGVCATSSWTQGQALARPQQITTESRSSSSSVLESMTRTAAVIFAGEVIRIRRPVEIAGSGLDAASGAVEVVFQIDQALRGCTGGSMYTLREWAGLWAGPTQRYSAGQRFLMFLRSPDANGLSSTVHGVEGAVPLRGGGAAPGPDDTNSKAAEWIVDLRWVQAQAPRRAVSPLRPVRWPDLRASLDSPESNPELEVEQDPMLRKATLPRIVVSRPSDPDMPPLSEVLNLCRGWVRQSDEAR